MTVHTYVVLQSEFPGVDGRAPQPSAQALRAEISSWTLGAGPMTIRKVRTGRHCVFRHYPPRQRLAARALQAGTAAARPVLNQSCCLRSLNLEPADDCRRHLLQAALSGSDVPAASFDRPSSSQPWGHRRTHLQISASFRLINCFLFCCCNLRSAAEHGEERPQARRLSDGHRASSDPT